MTKYKIIWWNKGRQFHAWTTEPQKEINRLHALGIKGAHCPVLGLR